MYLGEKTEGRYTADYILTEGNGSISRDNVIFVQGGEYGPAVVLGQITANEKFKPLDVTANDGSQIAAAINYARVDATNSDVEGVISARESELIGPQLIWPDGITDAQKTTAISQLQSRTLIVR